MRILYHLPLSPFARKVRLALAEKRIPFELRVERVWERRPEFLEMNAACTVPVLQEPNGLAIADSYAICEYLDEAYPDTGLLGRTLAERAETRRLVAWFDGKFATRGHPQPAVREADEAAARPRQPGCLGDPRRLPEPASRIWNISAGWRRRRAWLAGPQISLADFAAAAHLSALDYIGDIDWSMNEAAKDWYARCKSRPCFRALLAERVSGLTPPEHYADLDF